MPATVFLIRHPESTWNRRGRYQGRQDSRLSRLGTAQAELVTSRLNQARIDGIICSPLQRARSLARSIGRHHGVRPVSDARLIEISHGTWEGLTRAEVEPRYPELYREWIDRPHEVRFPEGESLTDVHERSIPLIEGLLGQGDRTWVVVTHDTVVRLAVAAAKREPLTGFAGVRLENAGITTLVGPSLAGSVRAVNDVTHLGAQRVDLKGQAL